MNRRRFISTSAAAVAAGALSSRVVGATARTRRAPRILLRGSWQSVNIGDIGHTPGALRLLERHFPEAELTLWPGDLGPGAREMLTQAFPRLKIVTGALDPQGKPSTPELAKAWEETDLWLSGSGSGFPHHQHAAAFYRATGKPMGVFGVSTDPISGFGNGRDPEGGTLEQIRARTNKFGSPRHRSFLDIFAIFRLKRL
jgi:hypothetical protein